MYFVTGRMRDTGVKFLLCWGALRPPIENGLFTLLSRFIHFTLSLFHELEIDLACCLFPDLLGTYDTIRYRRSVGVVYYLQKLFVDVLENDGVFGS